MNTSLTGVTDQIKGIFGDDVQINTSINADYINQSRESKNVTNGASIAVYLSTKPNQ